MSTFQFNRAVPVTVGRDYIEVPAIKPDDPIRQRELLELDAIYVPRGPGGKVAKDDLPDDVAYLDDISGGGGGGGSGSGPSGAPRSLILASGGLSTNPGPGVGFDLRRTGGVGDFPFTVLMPYLDLRSRIGSAGQAVVQLGGILEPSASAASQREDFLTLTLHSGSNSFDLRIWESDGANYSRMQFPLADYFDPAQFPEGGGPLAFRVDRVNPFDLWFAGAKLTGAPTGSGWTGPAFDEFMIAGGRNYQFGTQSLAFQLPILICGALSNNEVTQWMQTGALPRWAAEAHELTPQTSGSLIPGCKYRIVAAGGTFTAAGSGNNNVGTEFIANFTAPTWGTGEVIRLGLVVATEVQGPESFLFPDLTGRGQQIGASMYFGETQFEPRIRSDRAGSQVKVRLSWASSNTAQHLGPSSDPAFALADAVIQRIAVKSSVNLTGLTVGDDTDADRYVEATNITAGEWTELELEQRAPAGGTRAQRMLKVMPSSGAVTADLDVVLVTN